MDDEESGSRRYMTADAWLRSVIADAWSAYHEQAEELPDHFETQGLSRIWNAIAESALAYEVVH